MLDATHTGAVANPPPTFLGRPLRSANHHQIDRNRSYVVKGLLLGGQVSMLCGAPNVGKSAVMAAICAHVSMGRDFADHKVRRACVLYVGAEDAGGILDRAYPYMKGNNATAAPFDVIPDPINLLCEHTAEALICEVSLHVASKHCDIALVVFDTLNLCIGEGDENSSRDMSRAMGNAQRIAKEIGAHVMMIHHTGTQNHSRPRGSTVMEANVDTPLTLQRADENQPKGVVFITQQKQRSVEKSAQIAFRIAAFDAGVDSEGDRLTFPMAVPYKPQTSLQADDGKARKGPPATDARMGDVLRVLREVAHETPDAWIEAISIRERTGTSFNDVRDNPDSLRKATDRALASLVKSHAIEAGEGKTFRIRSS